MSRRALCTTTRTARLNTRTVPPRWASRSRSPSQIAADVAERSGTRGFQKSARFSFYLPVFPQLCYNGSRQKENQNMAEKRMVKRIIQILAGIFIVFTAIWGYYNAIDHIYELTFLSNFTCGIVLLSDGLTNLALNRKVPALIYQMILPCTNVVFFTCIFTLLGWHTFNFTGAFFFLHIINPPLALSVYLLCVELRIKSKADYMKRIFISPFMIMCYLLFDYIRYITTGNLVYGLISTERITILSAMLIGIGFYSLMAFMSYGLIDLKLTVQKKVNHRL